MRFFHLKVALCPGYFLFFQRKVPNVVTRTSCHIAFLIFLSIPLFAQDSSSVISSALTPVTIDRVVIRGNEVTKDYVILREMSLKPGDTLSQKAAEYDQNRIYSLGLFNRVELSYHVTEYKATLYVDVTERWYVFPFLVMGFRDRDWKKFYYGLGILHDNFRGRNEKVSASFALGYDPFFTLRYRNPILGLESNFFLSSRIYFTRERNKSLVSEQSGPNFDEDHFGLEGTLGERLNLFQSLSFTLAYEVLAVSQNEVGRTLSPNGRDAFITAGLSFVHDTRDLAEYPSTGTYVGASLNKYGLGESVVNYYRVYLDSRKFIPTLGGVILAGRLFANLAGGGTVPNYGHVYFGYEERIRGHFNEIYEGDDIFGSSLELRVPIIPVRYVKIGAIPIPQFGVWRLGLYAALFGDAGKVWYRSSSFDVRDLVKGYGVGLNLLLPYSAVFRVEYALNEARRGEFIFDISSSF
jgi:outer membrane protein assembly factor BamA